MLIITAWYDGPGIRVNDVNEKSYSERFIHLINIRVLKQTKFLPSPGSRRINGSAFSKYGSAGSIPLHVFHHLNKTKKRVISRK